MKIQVLMLALLPVAYGQASKCADLAKFEIPGVALVITKAETVPASAGGRSSAMPNVAVALPSFCLAEGMIDRRTGHADIRLFERLMEQVGEYVFLIDFYNWGDPLLNSRLDEFIRIASRYQVVSTVSSNLSLRTHRVFAGH